MGKRTLAEGPCSHEAGSTLVWLLGLILLSEFFPKIKFPRDHGCLQIRKYLALGISQFLNFKKFFRAGLGLQNT